MNKVLLYNELFSHYQKLLTLNEQDLFSLYYEENYTMDEIAKIKNITRSAVGKEIKKVENKLLKYEEIIKKNQITKELLNLINKPITENIKKDIEKIINI